MTKISTGKNNTENDLFAVYSEYSKTLRAWFVAYGVGVPSLILSQKDLWYQLVKAGNISLIAILLIAGLLAQVILSIINKSIMWVMYYGEANERFKKNSLIYYLLNRFSGCYFIDFLSDVISVVAYALATFLCFRSLVFV